MNIVGQFHFLPIMVCISYLQYNLFCHQSTFNFVYVHIFHYNANGDLFYYKSVSIIILIISGNRMRYPESLDNVASPFMIQNKWLLCIISIKERRSFSDSHNLWIQNFYVYNMCIMKTSSFEFLKIQFIFLANLKDIFIPNPTNQWQSN